jgi:biotin carboxylase
MKTLLIIGAGFLQAFVIKRAKELGYHTLTIDKNPCSVGFNYADEFGIVDIVDQEKCLGYAKTKMIDGVITAATDYGVLSSAYIAQQMGLPGLDYEVAKVIKNKYMVRRLLFEKTDSNVSQFYEINNVSELLKNKDAIKYPVMIKPCDGSGSKAANRADSSVELESACKEAIMSSLMGKALLEDFVQGKEYGVESFVYEGEVHVLGVMGKYMTTPPDYAELGHFMPSHLPKEDGVKDAARKSIKALGINFGAVNMDIIITGDDRICVVDVGARMGGNLIGSHIIPIGTGIDYMGNLIRAAVGDSVDMRPKTAGMNIATRLLALKPGKVIGLPDFDEIERQCKVNIYHHLKLGDTIRKYHNNLDCCGYVVAVAGEVEEAKRLAEEAKQLIDRSIKRDLGRDGCTD